MPNVGRTIPASICPSFNMYPVIVVIDTAMVIFTLLSSANTLIYFFNIWDKDIVSKVHELQDVILIIMKRLNYYEGT
jgi:hypothetical protein